MTDLTYLLDAVDDLTKPVRNKIIQDGPPGSGLAGTKMVTVELPPLLTQLDEAIRGTIGIGGSGSPAHTRNMLDSDALHRFMTISSLIKDWTKLAGAPVTPDALTNLRAWYVAWTVKPRETAEVKFYETKLKAWKGQIDAKLNPPKVWEQPGRCPSCDSESWWSKTTHEEYKFPLVVEYHQTGPNLIQEARALCRACEQVWSVRELAYLLEQAEAPAEETA
jgi:hypothetical protein